jgi:membrane fusion protein, heavy metal efflux system
MSPTMTAPSRRSLVAVALLASLALSACGRANLEAASSVEESLPGEVLLTPEQLRAAGLETLLAEPTSLAVPLRVSGSVITPDTAVASLGSIVEGQVGRVRVVVGDRVAAGAELLRIHSHELTDALRDQESASARLAYHQSALQRSRALFDAGAVSREEVERREAEHRQAEAELTRSTEWVRHLSPSPDGDVVLRSPRAGVVFAVHVRPGTVVTPGSPLVEVGSVEVLWVHGFIPEASALRLLPGAEVEVEFAPFSSVRTPGRIVRMGEVVDPVRRAVEVRVELEAVPPGVRPGMFATLSIPGPEVRERVVLPAAAVQRLDGEEIVFLEREPGRYEQLTVQAEALGDGTVAVEGLVRGVRVVTSGAYTLRSVLNGIEVE